MAGKKMHFFRGPKQIYPPIMLNFPPFLYVFLYFKGKISLQISKFWGNQAPVFANFSRHAHYQRKFCARQSQICLGTYVLFCFKADAGRARIPIFKIHLMSLTCLLYTGVQRSTMTMAHEKEKKQKKNNT